MTRALDRAGRHIERLALWLALAGGAVLIGIILVATASIIGRSLPFPLRVPGDVEIAQLGTALAVLAFLPYAHIKRANVIVDVVTSRLSPRARRALDLAAQVLFLMIALVLLRQVALGFRDKLGNGDQSMVLRIPDWATHGLAVLALAVLVLTIAWTVLRDLTGPG